jgi:hypothetical protein
VATPTKRVNPQADTRNVEVEGEIGTLDSVMDATPALAEVEVDSVVDTTRPQQSGPPLVVVRLNRDIEEMSWVAGGGRESYTFTSGNRYRVPVYIAHELEALGALWH